MKIARNLVYGTLMLSLTFPIAIPSVSATTSTTYQPTWTSVDQHTPAPEWFKDAKFGIYYHWGVFSVPAYSTEWYPRNMYRTERSENDHHISVFGDPSVWPYHNFIRGANDKNGNFTQFAPKLKSQGGNFDPNEWAQLFVDAGAKFAGPVAEHHDGYSMWNSSVNEWNSVGTGPHLDLLGLFASAIRSKNLKLLTSLHHAYNFNGFYRYAPAQSDPSLQKLYGQLSRPAENQLWFDKLKEVIDGYQPDIIWQDFMLDGVDEAQRLNFLSYYYNKAIDWNKEVVATYKDGFNTKGEILDYERGGPGELQPNYWLTDDSVSSSSWSYTQGMGYYSTKQMIHSLIDRVSKNGNLLLNIAPMADGTIPQGQKDILLGMGSWLKNYGEAIYATRAWASYGEGPTKMGGGQFVAPLVGAAQDIRFTRNKSNNTLYAIVMGWPGNGADLNISTLNSARFNTSTLTNVQLLGSTPGSYINLNKTQDANGLKVTMPASQPSADAYVIKLSFSGQIPTLGPEEAVGVFEAINYSGNSTNLALGTYTTAQLQAVGIGNNKISSVKVPSGFKAVGYEKDNFTGIAWPFTASNADLRNTGNNDNISSIKITLDENVYLKIVSLSNGMALDSGGSVAVGSPIKLHNMSPSANLQWHIIDNGNGYYRIVNRANGLVMDSGGTVAPGSTIKQSNWNSSNTNLEWQIAPTTGKNYKIVNRGNGLVIDSGGKVRQGADVKEYAWNGDSNMEWQIVKVN
ncbi:alpha-L-fucosidase [Paenibacillus alba]|uniref:alpha-L-fucosidase n=1 Tax=Paenibacillus alba TaxID=1197127 RepID=UPI001C202410|nr:alpha-L-fucosidase [Paenibacillus alba]